MKITIGESGETTLQWFEPLSPTLNPGWESYRRVSLAALNLAKVLNEELDEPTKAEAFQLLKAIVLGSNANIAKQSEVSGKRGAR